MIDTKNYSTAYVVMNKLVVQWFSDQNRRVGVLITPTALAHPRHPIKSRLRNKRRNLWVGWCVSSWRSWFWPVYAIYHIHTKHYSCILSNQNKLFLRDIHTKCWCGHRAWDKFIQHNMTLYICMISDIYDSSYVLFSTNLISNTSLHVERPLLRPFLVAYAEATLVRQKR